ncbi:biogenesis of lysosome-related organelles complex 1 subunit 1 [Brachionus plicatilis]|uniref:Biogenesis of lysosome-related organelles complex 1 subunit 1 n=1 Tax=Brachionus plicatilis TaxID=10195 RepID=A0A3M7QD60_BRAPC|nr:biogenesis of lysosome-related organelles complex 1 subunit 1 [Brachionus plicatilis]
MLSSMAKEHYHQQAARKQALEKKRIKAIEATNKFSQFLVDRLNKEVSEAFVNQKKIDAKIKQLNQNTSIFIKQSNQWIQLLENFNTALKELGDVENWSKKIESDMKIINNTLNDIVKEDNPQ